ncbi:MAG TPA: integrin alpha [Phycisphaerae bacterium]|nr:integrin alpha [Phycisphaerae bacterium]
MHSRYLIRRYSAVALFVLLGLGASMGLECPDDGGPPDPDVNPGNRAPRVQITSVTTPNGDGTAEQGELVTIDFTASDSEDRANVRIFASTSDNPTPDEEISILDNFPIGPGEGEGRAFWRTNNVPPGSYFVFAEISDGTFNAADNTGNPPVMVVFGDPVLVVPEGIGDPNSSPALEINLPATDAGLGNEDILTVRYTVSDPDSDEDTLTVRVLFDRDKDPGNDDSDPPIEVATETLAPGLVPAGDPQPVQEDITIDLNAVPIRFEVDEGRRPLPYFVRVEANDGQDHIVSEYAVGAVRILRATVDVVDLINIGGTFTGATLQGFDGNPVNPAAGSRVGSAIAPLGDLDNDGNDDFGLVGETASPFNIGRVGEVYVVYGRERRLPPDFASAAGFSSGRYSGLISVNTISSFVPFPAGDPRRELFFNIRGHIIPQTDLLSNAGNIGITSLAVLPDITEDGRPEFVFGSPQNFSPFDLEDVDPCDECTFEEDEFAPFTCLGDQDLHSGNDPLTSELEGVGELVANEWGPIDPDELEDLVEDNPLLAPTNVDLAIEARRISDMFRLVVHIEGRRADATVLPLTISALLEDQDGPLRTVNVVPVDQGEFQVDIVFTNPTLPVPEGGSVPPSVYDGLFLTMIRATADVEIETAEVSIDCVTIGDETTHPIRFSYFDGFPVELSQNAGCGTQVPAPISFESIEDFTPICPPVNRSDPFGGGTQFGNRDGHLCNEDQVQRAIAEAGADSPSVSNDNLEATNYQTGLAYVMGSDHLVTSINSGVDADSDGVPDDGPFGTYRGDGTRVAPSELIGQPIFRPQGGLGMRGARFRGAWYSPSGIYDPFGLFGYTVDTMPEFNAFGFSGIHELLVSAPRGGVFDIFTADLPDLVQIYSHDAGNPNSVESATATFTLGSTFTKVSTAIVLISGNAANIPRLRIGIAGQNSLPLPPVNGTNFSREALFWLGAGPEPANDELPTIEYFEIFGHPVANPNPFGFTVNAVLPETVLAQFESGTGTIAIEIMDDCTVTGSSVTLTSATLLVGGLVGKGYGVIFDNEDYTCSECNALENGRCVNPTPDGDPEGGEMRPMSWPSFGCDDSVDPPVRVFCSPSIVSYILGENDLDLFGYMRSAGDLNLDGVADIACGAPGSDNDPITRDLFCNPEPNPLTNNGKAYFIYGTPTLGTGRPCDLPERFEIRGTHDEDQFGRVQGNAGDLDGDSNDDVFFAAESYDALGEDFDNNGSPDVGNFGTDVGFAGVLFGRTFGNGTRSIRCEQVGTANFPGVKFVGGTAGARVGGGSTGHGDSATFGPGQRGQSGVASAGDFNSDGFEDLLITAPGQPWPAAKIEFEGDVADGDVVAINGLQFEFDTDGSITAGSIAVPITDTEALTAQRAMIDKLATQNPETVGASSLQAQNQFPAPLPDTPTINFVRRTFTSLSGWVTARGPGGGATNIQVTEMTRLGVAYLVYGDVALLTNKTFVLPQDLNRRNNQGTRVLKGMVFVGGFEKNSGVNDATPDEGPVEVVSRVGDIDGDGFVDVILGAPQADFINIIAPSERRQASGEAYLIYGNSFGLNASNQP